MMPLILQQFLWRQRQDSGSLSSEESRIGVNSGAGLVSEEWHH